MSIFRNFHKCLTQTTLKYNHPLNPRCTSTCTVRLIRNTPTIYGHDRDPAPVFFKPEVQSLLKSLTRINLGRVYRKRKLGEKVLEQPTYKFMTDEQLQETLAEAERRIDDLLQMPPAVQVRKPINRLLGKDPALQGLETSKYVFVDVTFGIKDCDRLIAVREPDGTLKEADWEMRDRINQVYFPKTGRNLKVPRMFEGDFLKDLLVRSEYEFVLDRACAQFEPDNPEYQRITSLTYEHVNERTGFEKLRSTRHFGPLAFYLVWFKNIDHLLLELIETAHVEDANCLLRLFGMMHQVEFGVTDLSSLDGISRYIEQVAQKKGALELALQAYKDLEKQRREFQSGIKAAHGHV